MTSKNEVPDKGLTLAQLRFCEKNRMSSQRKSISHARIYLAVAVLISVTVSNGVCSTSGPHRRMLQAVPCETLLNQNELFTGLVITDAVWESAEAPLQSFIDCLPPDVESILVFNTTSVFHTLPPSSSTPFRVEVMDIKQTAVVEAYSSVMFTSLSAFTARLRAESVPTDQNRRPRFQCHSDRPMLQIRGSGVILDDIRLQDCVIRNGSVVSVNGTLRVQNSVIAGVSGGKESAVFKGEGDSVIQIKNSMFRENKGPRAVDADGIRSLLVQESIFEENTASGAALIVVRRGQEMHVIDSRFTRTNGRCIHVTDTDTRVRNVTFRKNRATRGAALYLMGVGREVGVDVIDSRFGRNKASEEAGCILAEGPLLNVTVRECRATTNSARDGAVLAAINIRRLFVTKTRFTQNRAERYGGVIHSMATVPNGGTMTIKETKLKENRAAIGGAISVEGPIDVEITSETSLLNNTASEIGGAVRIFRRPHVVIRESEIQFNRAFNGGAIHCEGDSNESGNTTSVIIFDSHIRHNRARNDGGGILIKRSSAQLLNESALAYNSAKRNGGAMTAVRSARVRLNKCQIVDNTAANGGALYAEDTRSLQNLWIEIQTAVAILNNTAVDNGGAIYLLGRSVQFFAGKAAEFIGNEAAKNGGAIYARDSDRIETNSTTFRSNFASRGGGALCVSSVEGNSSVIISRTRFKSNSAAIGGAVCFRNHKSNFSSSLVVTMNTLVTFEHNLASSDGGAVYVSGPSEILVTTTSFLQNAASNHGGSIYLQRSSAFEMHSVTFEGNKAFQGGSMSATSSARIVMNLTSFKTNSASAGGALSLSSDIQLTATGTNFTDNIASNTSRGGGALFCQGSGNRSVVEFIDCIFLENLAGERPFSDGDTRTTSGGAIYATGSIDILLERSTFTDNQAAHNGGAIRMGAGCRIRARNSRWKSNGARSNGGALFSSGIYLRSLIDRCTFDDNTAVNGGALYASNISALVELRGSTFANNTAGARGGGIYGSDTLIDLSGSRFIQNRAGTRVLPDQSCPRLGAVFDPGAQSGGAVYVSGRGFARSVGTRFIESRFESNSAVVGGALALNSTTSVLIARCQFLKNEAERGGALIVDTSSLRSEQVSVVTQTSFTENQACEGGAIYGVGGSEGRSESNGGAVALMGNEFENNFARTSGGVLHGSTRLNDFSFCCDCKNELPTQPINASLLESLQDKCSDLLRGNQNGVNGYGPVFSTNRVGLEITPDTVSEHRSGQRLDPIVIRNVDALGQKIPDPSREISITASSEIRLEGQNQTLLDEGSAVLSDVFLSAIPGMWEIYLWEGDIIVGVISVTVAKCSMDERIENLICVKCDDGTFSGDPSGGCSRCPDHADCIYGRIIPQRGYWNTEMTSGEVIKCVRPEACLNTIPDTNDSRPSLSAARLSEIETCVKGYNGILCGACEEDFGHVLAQKCEKCDRRWSLFSGCLVVLYLIVTVKVMIKTSWPLDIVTPPLRSNPCEDHDSPEGSHPVQDYSISGELELEATPIQGHVEPTASFGIRTNPVILDSRLLLSSGETSDKAPMYRAHSAPASPRRPNTARLSPVQDGTPTSARLHEPSSTEINFAKPRDSQTMVLELEPAINENYVLTKPLLAEAIKIIITFFQTVCLALYAQVDWSDPSLLLLKLASFLGTSSSPGVSLACMFNSNDSWPDSIQAFTFLLLNPIFVSFLLVLFESFLALIECSAAVLWQRIKNLLVAVFYISFLPICHLCFRVLNCRKISVSTGDEYVWLEDTDVVCFEGRHRELLQYLCIPLLALTVVAFPLCFIVFLLSHTNLGKTERLRSWGLLFEAYKYKRRAWELVIFTRKLLLAAIFAYGYHYSILVQTLMAIGVTVFCLLAHSITSPYEKSERMLSHMETVSLFGAFVVYFGAGLIHAWDSGKMIISLVVCFLLILVFLRLLGGLAQHVMRTIDWTLGEFGKESYYSKPWPSKVSMFFRLKCSFFTATIQHVVKRYIQPRS